LNELAAMTGRDGELAEMIEAKQADPFPMRRHQIVLRSLTLAARATILKQLVDAAGAIQSRTGRTFPRDGVDPGARRDG
jgi:hypothetical protein